MLFFWFLQNNDDLRNLSLSGHVGFDSLPDQLVNKSTSQGFCFNILCVGRSPSGGTAPHSQPSLCPGQG